MEIYNVPISKIKPYRKNARRNDSSVVGVAESIREFGFVQPLVLDYKNEIVVGHTRYRAAKMLGMTEVPCVYASDLSDDEIKAYRLADNKTAEFAEWDNDKLTEELEALKDDNYEFKLDYFGDEPFPEFKDEEEQKQDVFGGDFGGDDYEAGEGQRCKCPKCGMFCLPKYITDQM